MKTLIAKLCIWILGKLGYDNGYQEKHEIKISVDAKEAIQTLQKISFELEKIREKMPSGQITLQDLTEKLKVN